MKHHDLLGSLDGTRPPADPDGRAGTGRPASGTFPTAAVPQECSRKGCRAAAAWRLEWNNPKIHTPERRKTWLACPEHRDWLADYLRSRGLLKDVLPVTPEEQG